MGRRYWLDESEERPSRRDESKRMAWDENESWEENESEWTDDEDDDDDDDDDDESWDGDEEDADLGGWGDSDR